MTNNLPPFLRLHVAEEPAAPPSPSLVNDTFATVTSAFEAATGWPLHLNAAASERRRFELGAGNNQQEKRSSELPIARRRALELADAISELYSRLDMLQTAVWHREAELAIGVPVSPRREEEEHLAARLEVMLRNGAEAVGCCSAGLYLLDDATTELKLRAAFGLPKERLLESGRPLAGAFAELEALIGHAVVLEDASLLPHWRLPEPFPAALCLPVSSPTDPLGTVWFYSESVREFSDQEIHLAEIVAGSIAAELQREVLLAECLASKQADRQIVRAVRWQQDHLPNIRPLVYGWDVAGWTANEDDLANGFYDWFVPTDGTLAISLGTSEGLPVESALSAGALQASARAHAEYPHTVAKMIKRVNETIWNSSAGGHVSSLFYGKATPDSGMIEYSLAGTIHAILVQKSDVELIQSDSPLLGTEPDLDPETRQVRMADGDVLLILDSSSNRPSTHLELSRQIRANRKATAEELIELVRSIAPQISLALILQRRITPIT
ncbi:MAG: SpoIIE family protein phosphatase [Planctomycetaceae bacterium]|nr:SpoIIE family protein phosphatase [Planctomycetales bacterium]MCB9921771.1 SpoIIE family protein phosphatase [Planctomycetaceae bacterium]